MNWHGECFMFVGNAVMTQYRCTELRCFATRLKSLREAAAATAEAGGKGAGTVQ
jgi:hypothetical protein